MCHQSQEAYWQVVQLYLGSPIQELHCFGTVGLVGKLDLALRFDICMVLRMWIYPQHNMKHNIRNWSSITLHLLLTE